MIAIPNAVHRIDAEQIPLPQSINELPHAKEPEQEEEICEKSSFAELLAGILRNTEDVQNIPAAENIINETNIDNSENLLMPEALSIEKINSLFEKNELTLHQDEKVPEDDLKALLKDNQPVFDLESIAAQANDGEFYRELSNLIRTDMAPSAELGDDFFNVNEASENILIENHTLDNLDHHIAEQINQAADNVRESLLAEIKKDREQKNISGKDNTNAVSEKKDKTDDAAMSAARNATLRSAEKTEKPGKLEELRASRRDVSARRDNITFEVRDMRSFGSAEQNRPFASIETNAGRTGSETHVREYTLELRLPEQNNAINQAATSWEAKASGALENLLARELHQSFNGDIVRHASMALKDGGEGTIRIALKPESLGNVKIALELSDNKITGQIFVESEEALNAFRKEIASLEQAFKDSGYEEANLNLSLTSDGQNEEGWTDNQTVPQIFASVYEGNSERIDSENGVSLVNVFIGHRKSSINLLA